MTALIEMPGLVVDGHLRPGYKQHTTVDNKRRVIVGISVTAANHYKGSTIVDAVDQAVEGGLVLMLSVPMALTAAVRTGQIWKSVEFV